MKIEKDIGFVLLGGIAWSLIIVGAGGYNFTFQGGGMVAIFVAAMIWLIGILAVPLVLRFKKNPRPQCALGFFASSLVACLLIVGFFSWIINAWSHG